jgi:hypothetical protein
MGALPVKQAVYALPDAPDAREDFEWLKAEVKSAGGDAAVFAADSVDRWADEALVEEFRRARQESYAALANEVERVLGRAGAKRRQRGTRAPSVQRLAQGFRERLTALERIDFFGSAGRDRALILLTQLEQHGRTAARPLSEPATADMTGRAEYRQRLWVTRPRPGVDRMASAWLIRRFIDVEARFGFARDRDALPEADAIPFDMFGVHFSHRADGCTFETLCTDFGIDDVAVARVAAIAHDLDLKDGRFGAPEAATVSSLIEGLQLAETDDQALLERGITLFDALYRSFTQSLRPARPRAIAKGTGPTPAKPTRRTRRP